ncbi:polysaccharide biosynthesis protein [Burkholderia ubonensis]|nr:polysaccharide biosynthesis protein [Burkholderia ubonensis]KVH78850.1 polysaccharide biosynthesis protein [Burkholderia ubonensis]KVO82801.1 polysaccharide biosynthesis protein [Burkholderia ubonensis]KVU05041.1 polysaccharide biosynthesis protein [Burkholderia ubonensis]KVU24991.1 polysaccharide biosynthesis protein [Burkholderia ubonensis]
MSLREEIMGRKENVRSIAFIYGGYAMRYLYLIVVIPFYGRVLGVAEYGRVLAAMSLMSVVWMIVGYGFTLVGIRDISGTQDRNEQNAIFSLHVSARFPTILAGAVVGICATYYSPLLSARPLIGILATALGIVSGSNLGWLFQGRHHFRVPVMLEVAGFALSLVLVLTLVRGPADSSWVLGSLLLSGVASTAVAYGMTVADLGLPRIAWRGVVRLLRGSTMLFCYSTGSVVLTASSTYMLTLLSTPAQVGYFGAAERFATIGLGLMAPAAQVFIPTISRQLAQGNHDGARATSLRGAVLLIGYGMLALCSALVLSPFLMPLILGSAFAPSAHVLQQLAWMFPFAAFNQFIGFYVFVPREKDHLLAVAGLISGVLNLTTALFLGPRYGATGMAMARVIGEVTLSLILLCLAIRSGLLKSIVRPSARLPEAAPSPAPAINE